MTVNINEGSELAHHQLFSVMNSQSLPFTVVAVSLNPRLTYGLACIPLMPSLQQLAALNRTRESQLASPPSIKFKAM